MPLWRRYVRHFIHMSRYGYTSSGAIGGLKVQMARGRQLQRCIEEIRIKELWMGGTIDALVREVYESRK